MAVTPTQEVTKLALVRASVNLICGLLVSGGFVASDFLPSEKDAYVAAILGGIVMFNAIISLIGKLRARNDAQNILRLVPFLLILPMLGGCERALQITTDVTSMSGAACARYLETPRRDGDVLVKHCATVLQLEVLVDWATGFLIFRPITPPQS